MDNKTKMPRRDESMGPFNRVSPRAWPLGKPAAGFIKIMLGWSLVLITVCAATGRWRPHEVSDTASYLQYSFSNAEGIVREVRLPGYPLVLAAAQWMVPDRGAALQLVVLGQILLHAFAVTWLTLELTAWRWPLIVAAASAGCVAIGCPFWDHVSTIATDSPAMSLGVITTVGILRGLRIGFSPRLLILLAGLVLSAITLRPAYLFLLPWASLIVMLRCGDALPVSLGRRLRDTTIVTTIPLVVLIAWCAFRFQVAGDFSLLPFGHQNMAAVTTQLLDEDELKRLSGPTGKLGSAIAERRVLVSTGASNLDAPQEKPVDGLDLRPVPDPALRADSYMTLENRWDAMTYLVVVPASAEVAGGDIVKQHRLLADLDQQIVRKYPVRYARWWLLAVRRGIWGSIANIIMHPIFLFVILAGSVMTVWNCYLPPKCASIPTFLSAPPPDAWRGGYRAFVLLALTYAAANLAFIALTSPPIGRLSDPGFVFIPALAVAAYFWRQRA